MCRENDVRPNTDLIKWHSTTWRFGKMTIRWNNVSGKWCGPTLTHLTRNLLVYNSILYTANFKSFVTIFENFDLSPAAKRADKPTPMLPSAYPIMLHVHQATYAYMNTFITRKQKARRPIRYITIPGNPWRPLCARANEGNSCSPCDSVALHARGFIFTFPGPSVPTMI